MNTIHQNNSSSSFYFTMSGEREKKRPISCSSFSPFLEVFFLLLLLPPSLLLLFFFYFNNLLYTHTHAHWHKTSNKPSNLLTLNSYFQVIAEQNKENATERFSLFAVENLSLHIEELNFIAINISFLEKKNWCTSFHYRSYGNTH